MDNLSAIATARDDGRKEGKEEGLAEGLERGEQNAKIETAKNFLKMGLSIVIAMLSNDSCTSS